MWRLLAFALLAVSVPANAQFDEKSEVGTYRVTTGFELWTIEIRADHSAHYAYRPDAGRPSNLEGSWKQKNDLVEVSIQGKIRGKSVYHDLHFVPVVWGERRYLVDEAEVPDFAGLALKWLDEKRDAKTQDSEIYEGPFLRTTGKSTPKRFGMPHAPARFMDWFVLK